MYRRPIARGRPGLLGTMARTAVVAGTATAVSGNVARRQHARQADAQQEAAAEQAAFQSQQQVAEMQAQLAAMQAQQAQAAVPAATAPATGGSDLMGQLQQLAQMKEMGALSEQEFQAAKAKLLGM